MKLRSFSMTMEAYKNQLKTVTRRDNCNQKVGDVFMGVNTVRGLKKGEHPIKFYPSIITRIDFEPLTDIIKRPYRDGQYEVLREGFPGWIRNPERFVDFYIKHNKGPRERNIYRIEFKKIMCRGPRDQSCIFNPECPLNHLPKFDPNLKKEIYLKGQSPKITEKLCKEIINFYNNKPESKYDCPARKDDSFMEGYGEFYCSIWTSHEKINSEGKNIGATFSCNFNCENGRCPKGF